MTRAVATLHEDYVAVIIECPSNRALVGQLYALETNFNEGRVLVEVHPGQLQELADTLSAVRLNHRTQQLIGKVTAIRDADTVEVHGIPVPWNLIESVEIVENYDPRSLTPAEAFKALYGQENPPWT